MDTFAFNVARGEEAVSSFARMPNEGDARFLGTDFAQGQMRVLVAAELLAAEAGAVGYVTLPSGEKGISNIGGARDIIGDFSRWLHPPADLAKAEGVRTLYLAAQGRVRQAHANARLAREAPADVGLLPLGAVVLVVLGVAALVATAYYATETKKTQIEVEGRRLREAARIDAACRLGKEQLERTGELPKEFWGLFRGDAQDEAKHDTLLPFVVGGVVTLGVLAAGYVGYRRYVA